MATIDIKHCTIRLSDGTTNKIDVKIGNGNLTYTEKRNMDYVKDRGLLDTVREGDEEPVDVRIDAQWIFITADSGATVPTIEDALKQRGPAATWVSSSTDLCEPYAVDITILDIPPCTGHGESIVLSDFRWENLNHDLRGSTISVTGKCNIKQATATRGTITTA